MDGWMLSVRAGWWGWLQAMKMQILQDYQENSGKEYRIEQNRMGRCTDGWMDDG